MGDRSSGHNLAENMATAWPGKAAGVTFTNPSKAYWAGNVKMIMQQGRGPIPTDRDLAYQLHSIKKKISPGGTVVYDAERNQKHHADKFWSLALAWSAGLDIIGQRDKGSGIKAARGRVVTRESVFG